MSKDPMGGDTCKYCKKGALNLWGNRYLTQTGVLKV